MTPRAVRPLAALLPAVVLAAQEVSPTALRDPDWRSRNAAALQLVLAERLDLPMLLAVMAPRPEDAPYAVGLGGGAFERGVDPRLRLAQDVANLPASYLGHEPVRWLARSEELIVPWSIDQLGAWVVLERARRAGGAAATDPPPVTIATTGLARIWLELHQPDDDALFAALADRARSRFVAEALSLAGERGARVLRRALADGGGQIWSAVCEVEPLTCIDGPMQRTAVMAQFLRDDGDWHAARLLLRLERPPVDEAVAFARAVKTLTERRRLALLLAALGAAAAPAAELLLTWSEIDDRVLVERALYALGEPGVLTPPLFALAARRLWALHEQLVDEDLGLLALDALARCGDGVTASMREQLERELLDGPPRLRPRVLGCLRALGSPSGIPPREKSRVARLGHPSTETMLAIADDGPAAQLYVIARLQLEPRGADLDALARRYAQTAPEAMREFLRRPEGAMRRARILRGLRSLGGDGGLGDDELLAWIDAEEPFGSEVRAWLTERLRVRPVAELLEQLAEPLSRGIGWSCLGGREPAVQRAACRRWLATAELGNGGAARVPRLLAALILCGLEGDGRGDDDVARVRRALAGPHRDDVLLALSRGPRLPDPLVFDVQTEFDREHATQAWIARQILLSR